MVKVPPQNFCDQWFNFFLFKQDTNDYISSGRRSDTSSDSYRVFQYKCIEPVRIFLHSGSGSGILCSSSNTLGRIRIFKFLKK